jgi:tetratricopeptide (TPR) repeat protein
MRGFLLLHLFEYSQSADAFVAAEKLDPNFAMAFWGEAMTFNAGVWNRVNAAAARAALNKFAPTPAERAARIADPREKAYMATVELLYDPAGTKRERDERYAAAMGKLSAAYPDDRNAQLFYALALLSRNEGVRDTPAYLRAAEISKAVFRLEPNNPGAAHYWIHGMDDPEHAAGALEAARALSRIAPDAPHAQHMCSHIFMALGMWDDVVSANREAMRVGDLINRSDGFPPNECGHYSNWLEYGYLQQGRIREAREVVSACAQTGADVAPWSGAHPGLHPYGAASLGGLQHRLAEALAMMSSMAVIEAPQTAAVAPTAADTSTFGPEAAAWYAFVTGLSSAKQGKVAEARVALQTMTAKVDAFSAGPDIDPEDLKALRVAVAELNGFIAYKDGQIDAGLAEIRRARDAYHAMAFAFGPPVTFKPADELLGDLLLEQKDAVGAREAFEQSLRRAPQRTLSLLGLARAEQLAGDTTSARATYKALLQIWHNADPDLPALEEARRYSRIANGPTASN